MSDLRILIGDSYKNHLGDTVKITALDMSDDYRCQYGFIYEGDNGNFYKEDGTCMIVGAGVQFDLNERVRVKPTVTVIHGTLGGGNARVIEPTPPTPAPEEKVMDTITFSWSDHKEWVGVLDSFKRGDGDFTNLSDSSRSALQKLLDASHNASQGSITLPITRVPPPLDVKIGQFYRNGLGQIVVITQSVASDDRLYKYDFRFCDHRGSFYTATGSVKSRVYKELDLLELVDVSAITDSEFQTIHDQTEARLRTEEKRRHSLFGKIGRRLGWLAEPAQETTGYVFARS